MRLAAARSARLTVAEPVSQLPARLEHCEGALPHFFASRPDVSEALHDVGLDVLVTPSR
jgi:hypothetical protein